MPARNVTLLIIAIVWEGKKIKNKITTIATSTTRTTTKKNRTNGTHVLQEQV